VTSVKTLMPLNHSHKGPVLVLGLGNILLKDEGVGVRVIERINRKFRFPPNVEVVDGGVLGLNLLGRIRDARNLIVVDAVKRGRPPGTLYRVSGEDISPRLYPKISLHQVDLIEALTICRILWGLPPTVILGVEPQDISDWGVELTEVVAAKVDDLVQMVLLELSSLGVAWEAGVGGIGQ
jgi:hydrogenase maturation protease